MTEHSGSSRTTPPPRRPDPGPLAGAAIQRAVLSEALQHPLTLYPFAVSALSAIYAGLVSPFVGGTPYAVGLALGAGLVSGGSFAWRYLVQGEDTARKKARDVIALQGQQRQEAVRQEVEQLHTQLEEGFTQLNARAGSRALQQLDRQYELLQPVLARQGQTGDAGELAAGRAAPLAEETYRQGLSVLREALDLLRMVGGANRTGLQEEIKELQREIAALARERSATSQERRALKQEMLASHQERLAALAGHEVRIEELFSQADRCEAALEQARGELVDLAAGSQEQQASAATDTLRRAIEQARLLEQRLSRTQEDAAPRLRQEGR